MALAPRSRPHFGLIIFGVAFAALGGLFAALVDAEGLKTARAGSRLLVEGRVASSMAVVEEGLAVIQRQVVEAQRKSGGSNEVELHWRVQSADPGPILLELGGATVKVGLSAASWREPPRAVPVDDTRVAGKTRLLGFAPNDPLSALVMVHRRGGELWLEAEEIFGGTAAEFRDHAGVGGRALVIVSRVLGGTGALTALLGLALALRRTRAPGSDAAHSPQ
jgi:hypothetical protein